MLCRPKNDMVFLTHLPLGEDEDVSHTRVQLQDARSRPDTRRIPDGRVREVRPGQPPRRPPREVPGVQGNWQGQHRPRGHRDRRSELLAWSSCAAVRTTRRSTTTSRLQKIVLRAITVNPLGRPKKIATSEDLTMARLRGESEGRLLARNEERRLIAEWLKHQTGTPRRSRVPHLLRRTHPRLIFHVQR